VWHLARAKQRPSDEFSNEIQYRSPNWGRLEQGLDMRMSMRTALIGLIKQNPPVVHHKLVPWFAWTQWSVAPDEAHQSVRCFKTISSTDRGN
jgi:hypothetical protein